MVTARGEKVSRFPAIPFGNQQMLSVEGANDEHTNAIRGQRIDQGLDDAGRLKCEGADSSQAGPFALCLDFVGYAIIRTYNRQFVISAHDCRKSRP